LSKVATIWVADLRISRATAEKISGKHGISGQEVRDAVVCVPGLRFTWDDDPERGLRALVEADIRGPVIVVLYPRPQDAYGDAWALGSVYRRHTD
jgi:hypothetical protein